MVIWFWQWIKSLEEMIVTKDAELAVKEREKLEANSPEETIPDVNTTDDILDVNSADENGDINLLKCSLQELVDIVSQYEPDFCNTCGKSFSLVELEECATAMKHCTAQNFVEKWVGGKSTNITVKRSEGYKL